MLDVPSSSNNDDYLVSLFGRRRESCMNFHYSKTQKKKLGSFKYRKHGKLFITTSDREAYHRGNR